jgi:hypothetical protein
VVQNQEGVFQMRGGFGTILPTLDDTIGFRSLTFDVGQSSSGRSKVDRC